MTSTAEISESTQTVLARVRRRWSPPTQLKVSEFADQELIVTSGPLSGAHWQTDFAPYQEGILNAFHEPGIEIVVVKGSSQFGKTACSVAIVAYHIAHDPCGALIVEPTVDPMAKDFAKNRLDPIIAASPILTKAVSKKRSKDSSNTTLAKTFRGGSLSIGGANSAASLAARSVRLLILDEVDRYPLELPGEGATISIAMKRTATFRGRRRILILSTPTIEGAPIDTWHARGDQRRYYVPCPACSTPHVYEWKNVRWKNNDPSTAHLRCPECDHEIDDAERIAVLSLGEWRSDNPDRRERNIVSFHIWEAYSPFSSLAEIVGSFMNAREKQKAGDNSEMHTWQNTTLGEAVAPDTGEGVEPSWVLTRREAYPAPVPGGVLCLTLGVDVQDDRLEALVCGWGLGEECWVIDWITMPGDTSGPDPWEQLDHLLECAFRHESGQHLEVRATCIDSAGHRTTIVYDYAQRNATRRVMAIIGRDGPIPMIAPPSRKKRLPGRPPVALYTIGVDSAKSLILNRLKLGEAGPGYIHLPMADWCGDEFAAQLTAEHLITKFSHGFPQTRWVKMRTRNEVLDMSVYALAAVRHLRPEFESLARSLRGDPPPAAREEKENARSSRPGPWIKRKKGWIGKGRR